MILSVILARPEILKDALLSGIIEQRNDPVIGDLVTQRLLAAGKHPPEVVETAQQWALKNANGHTAQWLIQNPLAACVAVTLDAELKAGR
jgi:hypothetical protein